MSNYFQIFISLFSLLNPILAITVYLDLTSGLKPAEKKNVGLACGIAVFCILAIFLFLGEPLMSALSIHDYSLQLAGGLIVLLIGVFMILKPSEKIEDNKHSYNPKRITTLGVSPLALPMIVGPASIVLVMLYGQQAQGILGKFAILLVLLLVSASVVVIFMLADYIAKAIGETGIILLTKMMGLIIASIAVEMMVSGLKSVIPILIQAARIANN